MPLPSVSSCILCEGVRPEPHRKAIIFGFYGVLPDVTMIVRELGKALPSIVLVLTVRGPGDDVPICGRIIEPNGQTLVSTEGLPTKTVGPLPENRGAIVAIGFEGLVFTLAGIYQIEILMEERTVFETSFRVEVGPVD
jgi:hypothetical protein